MQTGRYLLLILDTSGSIGRRDFKTTVDVLAFMVGLICNNVKVAVMTFATTMFQEICFDCITHGSNLSEIQKYKLDIYNAMISIKYRGGYTHSGEAINCACRYMLSGKCGFPVKENPIVDIMFVTDGHSNGPVNVCDAASCFNRFNGDVLSVGIGKNINDTENKCITGNHVNRPHILKLSDAATLKEVNDTVHKLIGSECVEIV